MSTINEHCMSDRCKFGTLYICDVITHCFNILCIHADTVMSILYYLYMLMSTVIPMHDCLTRVKHGGLSASQTAVFAPLAVRIEQRCASL